MSLPIGIGGTPADPRRIRTQNPAERASASVQPAEKQVSQSVVPKFGGVFDFVGSQVGKYGAPEKLQQAFLYTSKEGAEAVYPLELSVLAGRTESAYKRDGWMEVQERVFEEAAAAVIWLKGVDWLKAGFNRGQVKMPSWQHLNPEIAWNRPWGKQKNVDLTAQEMFSKDGKEIGSLLKVKSARWAFSVGLALAGVAYVVPTLNQLKTQMIMSHQISRRKRSQEGDNVQFGDPVTNNAHSATPGFGHNQTLTPYLQPVYSSYPFQRPIQAKSITQSGLPVYFGQESQHSNPILGSLTHPSQAISQFLQGAPAAPSGKDPKFGGFSGGSMVEGLGHLVEQTPYGSILVVDAGIAGGRSYVASKRSGFETVEVLVRDVGSLYFYILSVPHFMAAMSKGFDAAFMTSSGLEPKIVKTLNDKLLAELKQAGGARESAIMTQQLKSLLHGRNTEGQLIPEGWLKTEMRRANRVAFNDLLEKEAQVYLSGEGKSKAELVKKFMAQFGGHAVMPEQVQGTLEALKAGKGDFATLSTAERRDLGLAIKQAFRHTVGVRAEGLGKPEAFQLFDGKTGKFHSLDAHEQFKAAMEQMGKSGKEGKAFAQRLLTMARVDAGDQAHSMLRRGINMLREQSKQSSKAELFQNANKLADWLDGLKSKGLPLPLEGGHKNLGEIKNVMREFAGLAGSDTPKRDLLRHYEKEMTGLLSGGHSRLFSTAIQESEPALTGKLREMLQGGLYNNTPFLREAQGIVSQFKPDSREFENVGKATKMRESIGSYGNALLKRLDSKDFSKLSGQKLEDSLKDELRSFLNLNRNLNYASRSVAMAVTMFCLGWLVPHVQTTITKRLTGKDKNPGIASAAEALGYGKPEKAASKESSSSAPAQFPAANTGIFVGQTPKPYYPQLGQTAYQS